MNATRIILGTRNSPLALAQTERVQAALAQAWPKLNLSSQSMTTLGDTQLQQSFSQLVQAGHTGVFVKELEQALLTGRIDLAVHSYKDIPSQQPEGLTVCPVLPRDDARDALILGPQICEGSTLETLPPGARLGTASTRRQAMVKRLRPDLNFIDIRGNIHTRLKKLEAGQCDALLLAMAGFERMPDFLGLAKPRIVPCCPVSQLIPAPAQGQLAVEYRTADASIIEPLLAPLLPSPAQQIATQAERAVLTALAGGCSVPLGVYLNPQDATLYGWIQSGQTCYQHQVALDVYAPESAIAEMIQHLGQTEQP
ncbi:MAG: hydroxymethylbilane synthase [Vampirovibrionales bacterium]|nr:hydroxymethylbilane synthase [Vampirovibrionales bacterium]